MNINRNGETEKTVVLINGAMYLPGEGGYKRTMFLFDMMRKQGHSPILLTSDFNHYKKAVRNIDDFRKSNPDYSDIEFVHMRSYQKNQSLKRLLAEGDWTREVTKWVEENAGHIDVIMISMPDINTINNIHNICQKNNISLVIDVRDLRPESLRIVFGNELIYKIVTFKMKRDADRAYACADKLFAVSEEYLERGTVNDTHAKYRKAVYIGAVLEKFALGVDKYKNEIEKPDNELWITYAGTLGASYDLKTAIDAVAQLEEKEYCGKKIRLMVLGQGPERGTLESHVKDIGAKNVTFVGFVDYERMAAYLSKSDLTINAVKRKGSQSIINKVADYFAAGIPMLNGCVCKEQQEMVDRYEVGINYEPENVNELIIAIEELARNPERCAYMGLNAKRLASDKFDRRKTYQEIIDQLYN